MRFLGKFLLAAVILCMVLGFGEWLAYRLEPQFSFRSLHRLRPDAGWLYDLEPGATGKHPGAELEYRIAEHGFRDRERTKGKADGIYRIAVIGDSLTFGYGVPQEEGFVARLEELFRLEQTSADSETEIEVLNFGVSGYNPYNQLQLLESILPMYSPDLVLVQFCVNDLNDPRIHFGASTNRALGRLPRQAFPHPERQIDVGAERPAWGALCDRSRLCRRILAVFPAAPADGEAAAEYRGAFELRVGPEFSREFAWLAGIYKEMNEQARDAGANFGVLVFPHLFQLQSPEMPDIGISLRTLGVEEMFSVTELLGPFQRQDMAPEKLFFDLWHPTAEGHALAAAAIHQSLEPIVSSALSKSVPVKGD